MALRSVGRWDGAGGNSGASGPRVGLRRLADSAKQPQWRKLRKEAIEVARVSAGLRLIWVVRCQGVGSPIVGWPLPPRTRWCCRLQMSSVLRWVSCKSGNASLSAVLRSAARVLTTQALEQVCVDFAALRATGLAMGDAPSGCVCEPLAARAQTQDSLRSAVSQIGGKRKDKGIGR